MTTAKRTGLSSASLATVAAKAGVSISTVSRVVNGQTHRASAETVEKVRQVIAEVGYRPNHVGRSLRRQESRLVAMLVANLDNPVMATIAASTEAALRDAGYVMFLCDTHDRADLQDDYLYAMRSHGVQGYVLVACVPSPGLKEFSEGGVPIVFVSRRNPCGEGAFVGIDNIRAGADAADYLWSQGIREAAALYPLQGSTVTRDRAAGFCDRLLSLGVPSDKILRLTAPGLSHKDVGYLAVRDLLTAGRQWPPGIMCVSDQIAYGVYRAAREANVVIPDDCTVVSIDGNALNAWLAPWLTSICVPHGDYGREVVELLLSLWNGAGLSERILQHQLGLPTQLQVDIPLKSL
ncbi:LacI family DNA-binding transcriptional regulator [Telmatospirillum sp.]|uniref:LacI family DNA-binding transcriptional regulator n=1 Tax=Telmatospirillum sp. TaxID=2079197 RepID=UPI002843C8D6|nr:LacI family DNA-binding transcriptional regulator [Telmatospirillum sp.]MDR3440991.1 LacI family DNA-binding transcriptional regulator [Telmatospirillum sp.]